MDAPSVDVGSSRCRLPDGGEVVDRAGRLRPTLTPILAALIALTVLPSIPRAEQPIVKFAIFPSQSIVPCFEQIDWMYAGPIAKRLAERNDAELSYSFYAEGSDKTIVPPILELWTANVAHREPALETVRAAARRMEVDAVIMAWVRCSQYPDFPTHLYRVEMNVVDVARGRIYRASARSNWSGEAAAKAIDELFAGRTTAPKN